MVRRNAAATSAGAAPASTSRRPRSGAIAPSMAAKPDDPIGPKVGQDGSGVVEPALLLPALGGPDEVERRARRSRRRPTAPAVAAPAGRASTARLARRPLARRASARSATARPSARRRRPPRWPDGSCAGHRPRRCHRRPGCRPPPRARCAADAHADDHERRGEPLVVDPGGSVVEPSRSRAEAEIDPDVGKAGRRPRGQLDAQRPGPQRRSELDHRRSQPQQRQRRRDLEADEPAADDHHRRARPGRDGRAPQASGIIRGAQRDRSIGAGDRQPPDLRAGRDEGTLEPDRSASGQRGEPAVGVEPFDRRAREELDRAALVPRWRLRGQQLVRQVEAQELLAQRRPVVRRARLRTDDEDRSIEAVAPQRARAPRGRHASPDQEDVDGAIGAGVEVIHLAMLAAD